MQKSDLDKLRSDIGSGKLKSWNDIHSRYDNLWAKYTVDKQKHAFATLCELYGTENLTKAEWNEALKKAVDLQKYVSDQVYVTRKKDYDNPFVQSTFRNMDEMTAAIGTIEENSFIIQVRQETKDFEILTEEIKKRN
jgi:predicted metal-dependent HD superfamily phosphohydrolase